MSFEEFAKRSGEHVKTQAATRASERSRKLFHDAFLAEVYPHWQGPLLKIAKLPGVESATHSVDNGVPVAANGDELARQVAQREWVLGEGLCVAGGGVRAVVAYLFGGDENDGTMVRATAVGSAGGLLTWVGDNLKQWAGPLARLVEAAVDDVAAAAPLFGPLLVAALDQREARLAAEKAAAEAAEKARVEAEKKQAEALTRAKAEEIERQAAAERARKAAEEDAEGEPEPA